MMNILMLFLLLVVAAFAVFIYSRPQKQEKTDALSLMQQQLDAFRQQMLSNSQIINQQVGELTKTLNQNLQVISQQMLSSQKTVGDRLDAAARVVGDVHKSLGVLSQATERVFEVGKDISSLQNILRAPKLRGGLGELFLGDLLEQILPRENFRLQHRFKNGEIVDAAVRFGQRLVSVDAKFPLENFKKIIESASEEDKKAAKRNFIKDVKKHVDAIALKYILPDEDTFDFALMYIPAENVYYELIIKDNSDDEQNLSVYSLGKKVIPVSPNSFYAYLQVIVLGLRGFQVEKNVKEIIQNLSRLSADMLRFRQDFEVIGSHIRNLRNKYDEADKRIDNFEAKLLNICQTHKNEGLLTDERREQQV